MKVYAGCRQPIIGEHITPAHYGDDGLGGAVKDLPPIEVIVEDESASNALIRLAKERPKQITLLALGPLTNIAVAYLLDNRFFENLRQIVFMGGTVDSIGNMGPTTEFNVVTDPEACHVVLTNAKCPLTIVPWECGLHNLLTWVITFLNPSITNIIFFSGDLRTDIELHVRKSKIFAKSFGKRL